MEATMEKYFEARYYVEDYDEIMEELAFDEFMEEMAEDWEKRKAAEA